jgi:hypothetical protein
MVDLLGNSRRGLITNGEIALKIAKAIFDDLYAAEEVSAQGLFKVSDIGYAWDVVGQGGLRPGDGQAMSPIVMVIAKHDGQVRELTYSAVDC